MVLDLKGAWHSSFEALPQQPVCNHVTYSVLSDMYPLDDDVSLTVSDLYAYLAATDRMTGQTPAHFLT